MCLRSIWLTYYKKSFPTQTRVSSQLLKVNSLYIQKTTTKQTKKQIIQQLMTYNSLWWQRDELYRAVRYSALQVKLVEVKWMWQTKAPRAQNGWRTTQIKKQTSQFCLRLIHLKTNTSFLYFYFLLLFSPVSHSLYKMSKVFLNPTKNNLLWYQTPI